MRVAVIHDWLYTIGGAEKVLRSILRCFPNADLFSLFDFMDDKDRIKIGYSQAKTTFLQKMPLIRRHHRAYLPLMPLAVEQLDLRAYELVISSSYAVAKGVLTGPDQLHLAYVHSPIRYAWDMQHSYLNEIGLTSGIRSALIRMMLHRIRLWDIRTANGVNAYMANSDFIARRVEKVYGRKSKVIYPPVAVPLDMRNTPKQSFFLTASRLVPYKNTRAIVEAFRDMPNEKLIVVGTGPESERLRTSASANVEFRGFLPDEELRDLMGAARAFIFAAEEDFGIVAVEAQAEGTPVLALGRGGARESIIDDPEYPTGMFFQEPTAVAIRRTVQRFIEIEAKFTPRNCHQNALRFSEDRFETEFMDFVEYHRAQFARRLAVHRHRYVPSIPLNAEVP